MPEHYQLYFGGQNYTIITDLGEVNYVLLLPLDNHRGNI